MIAVATGIRAWLPVFVHAKGYYLLPAFTALLVLLRFALSRARVAHRLGEAGTTMARRGLFAALATAVAFSALVYVNFFNYHYRGFLNPYEFFHYYLGSKYAAEIGYFDMYNAALVADDETGRVYNPPDGLVSDLRTYGYRDLNDVLAERERYRALFSPERWQDWVKDVSFFKGRLGRKYWNEVLRDKGYNATPAWTLLVGSGLSGRVSTDDAAGMTLLASLDILLLVGAVACVGWTFGAWPALLMVVFIAASYLMAHVHMKGAFLRTDFVVALVGAMCALSKGRHGLAGALVGYSALARIFPAVFLFGPLVRLLQELVPVARDAVKGLRGRFGDGARVYGVVAVLLLGHAAAAAVLLQSAWLAVGEGTREVLAERVGAWSTVLPLLILPGSGAVGLLSLTVWGTARRILDTRHARFFGGFAIVVAVLAGATVVCSPETANWGAFARKIALHRTTYNHWNIGMTSIVVAQFDPPGPRVDAIAQRPPGARTWRGNVFFRPQAVQEKAGTILFLALAALVVSTLAALRLDDPLAFAFGFVPTFFLTAPTYYYYIILLLPFLFFANDLDRLRGTLGVLYLFLFGALGFAFYFAWDQYFTTYYWNSVLALVLTLAMTAAAFAGSRRR